MSFDLDYAEPHYETQREKRTRLLRALLIQRQDEVEAMKGLLSEIEHGLGKAEERQQAAERKYKALQDAVHDLLNALMAMEKDDAERIDAARDLQPPFGASKARREAWLEAKGQVLAKLSQQNRGERLVHATVVLSSLVRQR